MSQPGGRPTGHEDDWWGQLYDDDTAEDTGPARTGDSLDDRFASAAGAVHPAEGTGDGAGPQDGAAPPDPESTGGPDGPRAPHTVPAPRAQPPGSAGGDDWWAAPAGTAAAPPSPEATVPSPRTRPPAESGSGRDTPRADGPGIRPSGAGRGDGSPDAPRDAPPDGERGGAGGPDDRGAGPAAGAHAGAAGRGGTGMGGAGTGGTGMGAAGMGAAGTGSTGMGAAGTGGVGTGSTGMGGTGMGGAGMGAAGTGSTETGGAGTGGAGTGSTGMGGAGMGAAAMGGVGTGAAGTGSTGMGGAGTGGVGTGSTGMGGTGMGGAGMGAAGTGSAGTGSTETGGAGTGGVGMGPGSRPPGRQPAPWEPPPDTPPGPTSFPAGPLPPGFPHRAGPPDPGPRAAASDTGPASARAPRVPSQPPPPSAPPVPPAPPTAPPAGPPGTAGQGPGSPPPPATPPVPAHAPPPPRAPTVSVDGAAGSFGPTDPAPPAGAAADRRRPTLLDVPALPDPTDHIGSGPPTYDAEPTALPPADPDDLDDLVADTVLDGARYGVFALRAASVRGDSARYRGEPRRDSLLTARFGTGEHALVLVAMATGARATPGAHRAAAEVCRWIAQAVGRSHVRLAQDIRAARRGDLKSGLHRLTDRSLGRLRAGAAEQGLEPDEYAATLRCLLLPADPACRTRVFFGVGAGGLFRLREGVWRDIEPQVSEVTGEPVLGFGSLPAETPDGDRLTMDLGITTPPNPYDPAPGPPREPFRFRASVARPGDTLLMCSTGLAEPLRGEPDLSAHLSARWSDPAPPGLAAFLADTQVRVKGYADDRTAAAVWEA
ncbi:protein phosphatase 2C domain-containing protein [Streptomyces asoensis]|uniref:protein phosphatase 2C domain-containing protein n=1 Tax=Streptomyces asoensis TaxID=249586 RepID=UPI0037879F3C